MLAMGQMLDPWELDFHLSGMNLQVLNPDCDIGGDVAGTSPYD